MAHGLLSRNDATPLPLFSDSCQAYGRTVPQLSESGNGIASAAPLIAAHRAFKAMLTARHRPLTHASAPRTAFRRRCNAAKRHGAFFRFSNDLRAAQHELFSFRSIRARESALRAPRRLCARDVSGTRRLWRGGGE